MKNFRTSIMDKNSEWEKKAMKLKVHETLLLTTEVEQMDALHKYIFTQAENVSNRCS
jgi:hypothetical protein